MASFDASPTDCCAPLTVVFTDTSTADTSVVPTNTIESHYWQFGDGVGSSSEGDPSYTYEQAGVYTVTLTVTDSQGCSDTVVRTSYIAANPQPTASFDAAPADCCAPLTVVFTGTSVADLSVVPTNAIEGWYWDFGDGAGSSSEQSPSYNYEQPGVYTVTLSVTDSHGCSDTAVKASSIVVNPPPTASFDVSPDAGEVPLEVTLTDTSIADTSIVAANRIEEWYWDFGDGAGSSSEQNPSYIYQTPDQYTVTLTVTDSHGCSDDAGETVRVVDAFDRFIYLPLVTRGEPAETRGVGWKAPQDPQAPLGGVLHGALRLLHELFN
jgi:PKD repeat protein